MSANTAKAGLTYPSLADVPNVPSNMQTLAGQLDGIVIPKYASSAAQTAANPSPSNGDMCYRTDLKTYQMYDGSAWNQVSYGAWTSFTPTWTGSATNPTLGNGTLVSRWTRVGRMITWIGTLTAGSTTNGGTGFWSMSLPVAAAVNGLVTVGTADYANLGDNEYVGVVELDPSLSATKVGFVVKGQTSYLFQNVSNTFPVGSNANTRLYWNLTYEAAS